MKLSNLFWSVVHPRFQRDSMGTTLKIGTVAVRSTADSIGVRLGDKSYTLYAEFDGLRVVAYDHAADDPDFAKWKAARATSAAAPN